ncbi:MAG: AP2 domain-containing protein [Rhizobacter sp.]
MNSPSNSSGQWIKDFGIWHKVDAKGRDVYVVKVNRQRKSARKEFIVERYPSKEAAETAALAYRDLKMREVLPMTKRECTSILRKSNTSGVPGVAFQKSTNAAGLGYWVAYIKRPSQHMERKSFSVKEFGSQKAFELAVAAREEMLKQTSGWMSKHPRSAPLPDTPEPVVESLAVPPITQRPALKLDKKTLLARRVTRQCVLANGDVIERRYRVAVFRSPDGQTKLRQFSINRYGELDALLLAIEQRQCAFSPSHRPKQAV